MGTYIYYYNQLIPIRITPRELERHYSHAELRQNGGRPDVFNSRPKCLIDKLAKAYRIRPVINKRKKINNQYLETVLCIEYRELNITAIAKAKSTRLAWRRLAFKIHKLYCEKLIRI
jgi:hypothetical protein